MSSDAEAEVEVDIPESRVPRVRERGTRNRRRKPKTATGDVAHSVPARKSQEYSKVRAVMTAPPFSHLKGKDLFSFSESIDALAETELDLADLVLADDKRRLWKKWWRVLQTRFSLDVTKLADLTPKKTMDRLAMFVTLVTKVKPSAISAILLEAAGPSVAAEPLDALHDDVALRERIVDKYECVWE